MSDTHASFMVGDELLLSPWDGERRPSSAANGASSLDIMVGVEVIDAPISRCRRC
jgi:hypothetical protein